MKGYIFSIGLMFAGFVGLTTLALKASKERPSAPPAKSSSSPEADGMDPGMTGPKAGMGDGMAAPMAAPMAMTPAMGPDMGTMAPDMATGDMDPGMAGDMAPDMAPVMAVEAMTPPPPEKMEMEISFPSRRSRLQAEQKDKIKALVDKHGKKVLYLMMGYAGERRKKSRNRRLARSRCGYVRAVIRGKGVSRKRARCRIKVSRKNKEPEWRRVHIKVVK